METGFMARARAALEVELKAKNRGRPTVTAVDELRQPAEIKRAGDAARFDVVWANGLRETWDVWTLSDGSLHPVLRVTEKPGLPEAGAE